MGAGAIIVRMCEYCHKTGDGCGGLRVKNNVLLCASCTFLADIVTHIVAAARKDDVEPQSIAKYCVEASSSFVRAPNRDHIAVIWADN